MIDGGARRGGSLKSCMPAVTEQEMEREAEAKETGRPPETKLTKDSGKIAEPGFWDRGVEKVCIGNGRIR